MKKQQRFTRSAIALAITIMVTLQVNAATYSLSGDFSTTANPNGVWTYGYKAASSTAFQAFSAMTKNAYGVTGFDRWNMPSAAEPMVMRNNTNGLISWSTLRLDGQQVQLHPGSKLEQATVRWTAPSSGDWKIDAAFRGNDIAPTTTLVSILKNGNSLFSGAVNTFGAGSSYSNSITVVAGDVIDFVVDAKGSYYNDSTGLAVTITNSSALPTCTLTPTPSTITAGQPATLTATCTPAATSYQWSDTACASTSSTCTVTPNITTNYSVKGGNSGGMGVAAGGIVTVYKTPELTIDSPEGFIAGKTITLKSNLLQLGIEYKMCIGTGSKNYNLGCHSVPIPFSFPMESNYDFYVAIKAIKNGVDVGFSNAVRVKGVKPIDPLLSTHWNQLAKAIDLDQDGKLTETVYLPGCTAVAIGQLINYYHTNGYERNWLDFMLSGVHVYPKAQVCNREKWNLRETCEMKSFDLTIPEPGYKLLPTYAKQNDNDVDDFLFQVALGLDSEFKKCGLLFGMAFGCATGSGGDIDYSNSKEELLQKYGMYTGENVLDSIMTLLKDRFRFSLQQPILAPWDETINESDFKKSIDFIMSELNNSRPILFYLNADKSAHLTIIDGYRIGADGRPEFHINFGWGENDCNTKLWRSPFEKPLKAYKTDSCNDSGIRYSWKNAALLPASPMR